MHNYFYDERHEAFRAIVREFVRFEIGPSYRHWDQARQIPLELYAKLGEAGCIGLTIPDEFGGFGELDYRFRMVISEELARVQSPGVSIALSVHDDVVTPYLLDLASPEQRARWLPAMANGTRLGALAATEARAGSDLQAITTTAELDGDDWVLDGEKTFITNGINASIVLVLARTSPNPEEPGFTIFVVEEGMPGFERAQKLDKIGLHAQDTAQLRFHDVRVPAANVLGEVGAGLHYLMQRLPRERLSIAAIAQASGEAAYDWARDYVFSREAFGHPLGELQTVRFELAELETELTVSRAYLERCILAMNDGELTTVDAAKAKWWATELEQRVITRCLQLHGGNGFLEDYPIGRAFRDSRVQSIHGGTTEIMKEIIARDIARRTQS